MKIPRGFRVKPRLVKIIQCKIQRKRKHSTYKRLNPPDYTTKAISKLGKLARSLLKTAEKLWVSKPGKNYIRVGQENPVPKGHLAVYVGEKEAESRRVLVPVIYFNHPLFGDLLREAEKVYGFDHRGGIHVPCRISEFENVKTKISGGGSGGGGEGLRTRRSWRIGL